MNLAQTAGRRQRWDVRPRSLWFCPLGRFNHPAGGLGERNSALHRCWSGDWQQPTRRGRGRKVARGASTSRDVKNGTTSGDVHENKGQHDNLPDTNDDISTQLHAILHSSTCILQKPSALLP